REAPTPETAVLSAVRDVESVGGAVRVLRVGNEDEWLTGAEIAERTGRSRQSIGQLVWGDRGVTGVREIPGSGRPSRCSKSTLELGRGAVVVSPLPAELGARRSAAARRRLPRRCQRPARLAGTSSAKPRRAAGARRTP